MGRKNKRTNDSSLAKQQKTKDNVARLVSMQKGIVATIVYGREWDYITLPTICTYLSTDYCCKIILLKSKTS